MNPRFLVDAQLPPGLAKRLVEAGFEAEHVASRGLLHATDRDIRQAAAAESLVIITKDEDFRSLAVRSGHEPQVVWIRFGNVSNAVLWMRLAGVLAEVADALRAGERVVEVR